MNAKQAAELIRRSLAQDHHDGTTVEQVLEMVRTGAAQMWPGEHAVGVTEITQDEGKRALTFWIVGGDLAEIVALRPGVEAYARAWGCAVARFIPARKGWARVLKTFGYEPVGNGRVEKNL